MAAKRNKVQKFSRQQAIEMSGSTSSRLSYLDKMGLVQPEKIGEDLGRKPVVVYTEEQIQLIRLIDRAYQYVGFEQIKIAIERNCLERLIQTLSELLG